MSTPLSTNTSPEEVLHQRARALAQGAAPDTHAQERLEVLTFRIAPEVYAAETRHIREVHPLRNLVPLPGTPRFVAGIVNVRGHILPVLDLKRFFDLPEAGITDLHCILAIHGEGLEFGLLADVVLGVRSIPVDQLQTSLPTLTGIRGEYLRGVTAERLVVLDVERMLADPKLIVHEDVAG